MCDKPTHLRCIKETFNEEQFVCQKCEPCPEPVSTEEFSAEEADVQEDIIEDSNASVAIEDSASHQPFEEHDPGSNEPATNEHHSSVQFKTVRELLMNIAGTSCSTF